jgi:hypothetical protein
VFLRILALVALMAPLFAQPAPATSLLPLTPGAVNVLQAWDHSASFRFTVESALTFDDRRVGRVRFENPWFTYSWLVFEDATGTWLSGFAVGPTEYRFAAPAPLFPANGVPGQAWSNDYAKVVQTGAAFTVVTPAGTFTNASRFRITITGMADQEYTVVPGVGIIAVGAASADMQLESRTAGSAAPGQGPYPAACTLAGISAIPTDPALDYTHRAGALAAAMDLQPRFNVSTIAWDELEPSPGSYSVSRIVDEIKLADANGLSKALNIRTVDSGADRMPADLRGRAWDDPLVISRFAAAVNYLLGRLPSGVQWLHLAYEVEPYFSARPNAISSFRTFLGMSEAAIRPKTKASIGIIFGFDATKASNSVFSQLADLSDHIAFDYYDLKAATPYSHVSVTAPRFDVPTMLAMAGNKQVILTEVGFSTSTASGGGTGLQATFFQNVLDEVRKTRGQIAAVNVWSLNDLTLSLGNSAANYYGVNSSINVQFLTSLGLRTSMGVAKPAYPVVRAGFLGFKSMPSCSQ